MQRTPEAPAERRGTDAAQRQVVEAGGPASHSFCVVGNYGLPMTTDVQEYQTSWRINVPAARLLTRPVRPIERGSAQRRNQIETCTAALDEASFTRHLTVVALQATEADSAALTMRTCRLL